MNKISCDMIQDLLPLYCDGVCSQASKQAVLTHIHSCEACAEELRMLDLPIDFPERQEEVETAKAASTAWKANRRRAFRTGIVLAILLFAVAAFLFLAPHYTRTCTADDLAALEIQLEQYSEVESIELQGVTQKGDYLAAFGYDQEGKYHCGVFTRDDIFQNRWRSCGSLNKVRPGKLTSWNYETDLGDTVLICFGAELKESITGYTFTNSGITYTCPVKDRTVLDIFFIQDTYDYRTHLEPIYEP